jgi:hypothetical protein
VRRPSPSTTTAMKNARAAVVALLSAAWLGVGCSLRVEGNNGYLGPDAEDWAHPAKRDGGGDDVDEDVDEDADVDGNQVDASRADWVGAWQYYKGASGYSCGVSFLAVASEGTVLVAAAGRGLVVQRDGCSFDFSVAGNVATAKPDQVCEAWVVQVPDWSLTLKADGTMDEVQGGRVWLDGMPCTVSGHSSLRRQ